MVSAFLDQISSNGNMFGMVCIQLTQPCPLISMGIYAFSLLIFYPVFTPKEAQGSKHGQLGWTSWDGNN